MKANWERFQTGAEKYAAYLETPEGRLRHDLAFANLMDFASPLQPAGQLKALDIGGGTGATAVRLAQLGFEVTLWDASAEMLAIASDAAQKNGVSQLVLPREGDVADLRRASFAESFDLIVCHNVLEYVEAPGPVIRDATGLLRPGRTAIMSIVVRNQAGEALKAGIRSGDLEAARNALNGEWGHESLFGGPVRLFRPDSLRSLLQEASLEVIAERGVRVIADYLPPQISVEVEYSRIFDLEREMGARRELAGMARYSQFIVRRAPATESRYE